MISYRKIALSLAVIATLGGCRDEPGESSPTVFGEARAATLELPVGVGDGDARPLVVVLHAYGSSGAEALAYTGLLPFLTDAGFFVTAPDGLLDSNGSRFWNGGACCDFDETGVDDAAYIASLAEEIGSSWPISEVHVVGVEAGGFLAYDIACRFADSLAGIVSVGGMAPFECVGREGLSALHVHGDSDPIIDYSGTAEYPSALGSAALMADRSGCEPLPILEQRVDLDLDVPGLETRIAGFPGCSTRIELWTLEGSAHLPPLTADFAALLRDAL